MHCRYLINSTDDTPIYNSGKHNSTLTTHGRAQFDDWYHMNIPSRIDYYQLTLKHVGNSWVFSSADFWPIVSPPFLSLAPSCFLLCLSF